MTTLESWLQKATRGLSSAAAAQVRTEIREHYEEAREGTGSEQLALQALGDAHAANRQYRRVLLTAGEARMLGNAKWEAHAVCSRPWLKGLLLAAPAGFLLGAIACALTGAGGTAQILLAVALWTSLLYAVPSLPIYTPWRSRIFRTVRCLALLAVLYLAFGTKWLEWSWLFFACLWPLVWIEWTKISIRRKLGPSNWPKALYL